MTLGNCNREGHRGGFSICAQVLYKSFVTIVDYSGNCVCRNATQYYGYHMHAYAPRHFPFVRDPGITPKYGQSTLANKFGRYTTDIPLPFTPTPSLPDNPKVPYKITYTKSRPFESPLQHTSRTHPPHLPRRRTCNPSNTRDTPCTDTPNPHGRCPNQWTCNSQPHCFWRRRRRRLFHSY